MSQQDANQFAAELGQFLAEPKPQKTKRQPKQQQQPGPLEGLYGEAFKGL